MNSYRMASPNDLDSSSEASSSSYYMGSPQGSPAQQVPHLTNSNGPYLRIIVEPQNYFRFRYVSEMVGTHGCLLGKTSDDRNAKTHPTVELVNYKGEAIIRCQLAQDKNENNHPHKLQEDDQDREVSYKVPEQGSYKVGFAGMGIIHTAKKDVADLLFKQRAADVMNNVELKQLRAQCEAEAKTINLNIVRLKFSAYDFATSQEICPPIYSEPIHNMKSAATNDLKICRISRTSGRPSGGQDVYIFVEKVNKKNIQILFYELDELGNRSWMAYGQFIQSDVHHQYGIVFRTPQYREPATPVDVPVYVELVRPSDGRTSEPKEFVYKAEQVHKLMKKRKADSSYSSIESVSGKSTGVPISLLDKHEDDYMEVYGAIPTVIPKVPVPHTTLNPSELVSSRNPMFGSTPINNPSSSSLAELHFTSSEFAKYLEQTDLDAEAISKFSNAEALPDYMQILGLENPAGTNALPENGYDSLSIGSSAMGFIHLVPDSGRGKDKKDDQGVSASNDTMSTDAVQKMKNEYPAYFKAEDGVEVKELVKDLVEMMRSKKAYRKQDVRNKLERLFEIRLSNGDTFLHMTLVNNPQSFEYIVRLIYSGRMQHLFDCANNKQQTILHMAVANDMPAMVNLLIAKGCSPMSKDYEDNTPIHYAVKYQHCLDTLLDAVRKHNVPCDLNAINVEKQTALHLAVLFGSPTAARLLLNQGASYNCRDMEGRTALHLAAYDDRLEVARALLEYMSPRDVDVTDGCGNTALQIVCGSSLRPHSVEMTRLLLHKKADPLKHEEHNDCAWQLTRDKPQLREVIVSLHNFQLNYEDDVKSEPEEDEYESADEGDEPGLAELSAYRREVSARLDASGAWKEVAKRVRLDSLTSWYSAQPSPTYTMLNHLKESRDDITSKSLALILDDIGETEAAQIIRKYI